jgi:hypothetical protein
MITTPTNRASSCAVWEYLRRHCFFSPPGAGADPATNGPLSPDGQTARWALGPPLWGKDPLAEPCHHPRRSGGATGLWADEVYRPVDECPHLAGLPRRNRRPTCGVSRYDLKRYGQTPHHRFAEHLWWVDGDVTPMSIGTQAEGSERTWMGRHRSKTGRET